MGINRDFSNAMVILENKLLSALEVNAGKDLPYHNNKHMEGVWGIAQHIWAFDRDTKDPVVNEQSLTILMCAALLHDYDHSGGDTTDHYNVLRAREYVSELLAQEHMAVSPEIREAVDKAIACTVYPFTVEPVTQVEKVLRDADILYATLSRDPRIIMEDLRAEIGVAAKREISYQEMLDGQTKFTESVVLFTTSGKGVWDIHQPKYLEQLINYVKEREQPE